MDSIRQLDARPASSVRNAGATVLRTYGIGAQILRDLGLKRMRVLSGTSMAVNECSRAYTASGSPEVRLVELRGRICAY
jgi:hypothetical protein